MYSRFPLTSTPGLQCIVVRPSSPFLSIIVLSFLLSPLSTATGAMSSIYTLFNAGQIVDNQHRGGPQRDTKNVPPKLLDSEMSVDFSSLTLSPSPTHPSSREIVRLMTKLHLVIPYQRRSNIISLALIQSNSGSVVVRPVVDM